MFYLSRASLLICVFGCVLSSLFCVVSTGASDCLETLVSEMTDYVMCRAGRKTLLLHSDNPFAA